MEDYITLNDINRLCGFVQNGSNEVLKIYQDEATRTWHVSRGNRAYWGDSLRQALDNALMDVEDF